MKYLSGERQQYRDRSLPRIVAESRSYFVLPLLLAPPPSGLAPLPLSTLHPKCYRPGEGSSCLLISLFIARFLPPSAPC